jgi:hypothetical protein
MGFLDAHITIEALAVNDMQLARFGQSNLNRLFFCVCGSAGASTQI